jgi:hypothetical protein
MVRKCHKGEKDEGGQGTFLACGVSTSSFFSFFFRVSTRTISLSLSTHTHKAHKKKTKRLHLLSIGLIGRSSSYCALPKKEATFIHSGGKERKNERGGGGHDGANIEKVQSRERERERETRKGCVNFEGSCHVLEGRAREALDVGEWSLARPA